MPWCKRWWIFDFHRNPESFWVDQELMFLKESVAGWFSLCYFLTNNGFHMIMLLFQHAFSKLRRKLTDELKKQQGHRRPTAIFQNLLIDQAISSLQHNVSVKLQEWIYVYYRLQHMYINTVMKYQLHQGYMFRLLNSHHQANALAWWWLFYGRNM